MLFIIIYFLCLTRLSVVNSSGNQPLNFTKNCLSSKLFGRLAWPLISSTIRGKCKIRRAIFFSISNPRPWKLYEWMQWDFRINNILMNKGKKKFLFLNFDLQIMLVKKQITLLLIRFVHTCIFIWLCFHQLHWKCINQSTSTLQFSYHFQLSTAKTLKYTDYRICYMFKLNIVHMLKRDTVFNFRWRWSLVITHMIPVR